MKNILNRIFWFLSSQLGVDLIKLLSSIYRIPFFLKDYYNFKNKFTGKLVLKPCFHDRNEEGGVTKSEYFLQDLFVARLIYEANPLKHVDVGSRIDGFVSHVASFREIEVFDVRPITSFISGIIFKQADLMKGVSVSDQNLTGYCDSLSCLHALEHFGLGRYGDPLDPDGHVKGFSNMASLLKSGGTFYLSTPIGQERVEFNANRVFNPSAILSLAKDNYLQLKQMLVIDLNGQCNEVYANDDTLHSLATDSYNLCIFIFLKM